MINRMIISVFLATICDEQYVVITVYRTKRFYHTEFHTVVTEEGCHNKNDVSHPELEVTMVAL